MSLETDLPAAYDVRPTRRWLRRSLLALGIGAGLYAALWWWPQHQIAQADGTWDCLHAIEQSGSGDPAACRPDLWLAAKLPWTAYDAAKAARADAIGALQLRLAASRDLDRGARDQAAEAVAQTGDVDAAWRAGAFEAVAAHVPPKATRYDLDQALTAAVTLADAGALRRIAGVPAVPSAMLARVQCLLGLDARQAVQDVRAEWAAKAKRVASEVSEATANRLNLVEAEELDDIADACAPRTGTVPVTTLRQAWRAVIAGATPAAFPSDHGDGQSRESLVVRHLTGNVDPKHYDMLRGPLDADTPSEALAGEWLGAHGAAPAVEAETARFVATLAGAASPKDAPWLERSAYILAQHAATEWLWRGDVPHARESLALATRLAHAPDIRQTIETRLVLVPLLQLAGDLDAALAEAQALPALAAHLEPDPYADPQDARKEQLRLQTRIALATALLQIAQGKPDDAFATLAPVERLDEATFWGVDVDIVWLRAALAVRLHRDVLASLPAPKPYDADTEVALLYRDAQAAPAELPALRYQYWRDIGHRPPVAVLPAALYLEGQLARGGDVELWLDANRAASSQVDPIVYAAARAEAARWRGDEAAARTWDARLAAVRALVTDDRTAYFLRSAFSSID